MSGKQMRCSGRVAREKSTVAAMIALYCRKRHRNNSALQLCAECTALRDYAFSRLERCRYKSDKPTCADCLTHCYAPPQREQIRTVMRFAGPRMLIYHPFLALQHFLDSKRFRPKPNF